MPSLRLISDRAPRFVLLLLAIVAELMLVPLLAESSLGLRGTQGLAILVLLTALWAAGADAISVLLFVPALGLHLLGEFWDSTALAAAALVLRALFFSYVAGRIMWRTLRQPDVTLDTIAGAASAYALLAMIWGTLYLLVERLRPGSFHIDPAWLIGPERDPIAALVYFSFVTITTVGYGDITPAWPGAGGLAAAEAFVGQLYLAVTIARLVGLHTARHG